MTKALSPSAKYFDQYGVCPCGCLPRERYVIDHEAGTATLSERVYVLPGNKHKVEKLDVPITRKIVIEDCGPCLGEVQ